jgi:hypothetical protein
MLFAIMIIAIAMPFAFRQISDTATRMKHLNIAREFIQSTDFIQSYMRLHDDSFPMDELVEVESDDEDRMIFIIKTEHATTAFVVLSNHSLNMIEATHVKSLIGDNAAVVEQDGAAYSYGGNWSVRIEDSMPGDIVLRISNMRRDNNAERFLHKTTLTDDQLSTMQRDLFMGNNSIQDIGNINARRISTNDLDINLLRVPIISATSLFFQNGLNLNPERSNFRAFRVTGDVIGFRAITGEKFDNRRLGIVAERATITNRLNVLGNLDVRAPLRRSISGFAGVSAASARIPYLDTELLHFIPDFGLVVSGENLYSGTPPVRIGSWNFPNTGNVGPRFNSLLLNRRSPVLATPDFSEILKEGWR